MKKTSNLILVVALFLVVALITGSHPLTAVGERVLYYDTTYVHEDVARQFIFVLSGRDLWNEFKLLEHEHDSIVSKSGTFVSTMDIVKFLSDDFVQIPLEEFDSRMKEHTNSSAVPAIKVSVAEQAFKAIYGKEFDNFRNIYFVDYNGCEYVTANYFWSIIDAKMAS